MSKKQVRQHFRDACLSRDKNKCVCCGKADALEVHHITNRNEIENGGYIKENGVSLCPDCHYKAEMHYQTKGLEFPEYSEDALYKKIGSSKDVAIRVAKNGHEL